MNASHLLTSPRGSRWNGIDLVKWCMALCVIAIHTEPLIAYKGTALYAVYESVVDCAVPFFFLSSGFLLAVKLQTPFRAPENRPILRRFLRRMLGMYLIWSAVYFPLDLAEAIRNKQGAVRFAADYLLKLVFAGIHHNSWHLWYLLSACYAALLLLLIMRLRLPFGAAVAAGCVLALLGLTFDRIHAQENLPHLLGRLDYLLNAAHVNNLLFRGFFYLPVGMLFARRLLRPPLAAVLLLGGLTAHCLVDGFAASLACAVSSVGLFCLAQNLTLPDSPLYPALRRMSTATYLMHMLVFTALYWAVYREKTFGAAMFFGTAAICTLLSLGWVLLRQRRKTT